MRTDLSCEAVKIWSSYFEKCKLRMGPEWPDILENVPLAELFHIRIILS